MEERTSIGRESEILMDQVEQKNGEWRTYYDCANSVEREENTLVESSWSHHLKVPES